MSKEYETTFYRYEERLKQIREGDTGPMLSDLSLALGFLLGADMPG